jgi:TRAP-type C4-dicarboxylate transport system substrate-binding protein
MGEAWKKATNGSVSLKIYAGSAYGSEAEMVGSMLGEKSSLQAALLTAVGLSEIEPAVTGLQNIPMGFRTLDEVDYVGSKLKPALEERLGRKGFVVIFWTDTGWVRFFSSKPVTRPDDLKKLKLFIWAGDQQGVRIYQRAGFNPRPLETADILVGLRTGLIEAAPLPPFFAMAGQIDSPAPYMLELNWAPLVGALVMRRDVWEQIPADARASLLRIAATQGQEITANGRKENADAVALMSSKRNLKVTPVTPEIEAEWRKVAESVYGDMRGTVVPADVFDQALALLAEYRAGKTP